jgi:hypothetical protein
MRQARCRRYWRYSTSKAGRAEKGGAHGRSPCSTGASAPEPLVAKNLRLDHPLRVARDADIRSAVDAFLATPKRIVGYDISPLWAPGYAPGTVEMKYPLEIEGELRGAQLMIVGFPRERELKFRVGILFPAMICRLDYTDETHQNSATGVLAGAVPPEVVGPHYHSWPLNRRFFRGTVRPVELHDAVPYLEPGRTFDAILRWFCTETNIEQLPPDHLIALPRADTLL